MSASPGRIVAEVAADIPRPRSPDTLVDARFVEAKRQCMEIIRVESQKAFEQQVKRTG
jgi:NitT/TauT family transport system ATP-binding protein